MGCRICGDPTATYRGRSGLTLCDWCHEETPKKVDRETFEREYWKGWADTVPESIRREFYDDYRHSTYGPVADYVAATVSETL